jgi:hypothetical protein
MKRTWFQAQIKQDIAISTQIEHERHSTHKRGSYSIFLKRHSQAYISQSNQEHSYTSHEHHKQSHNLISSISWWAKHMREAHLYGICYKCSLWYKDANMIRYINENATCICTSTLPTEAQTGKTTPSSPRKRANVAWSKGLVRISAMWRPRFSTGLINPSHPVNSVDFGQTTVHLGHHLKNFTDKP